MSRSIQPSERYRILREVIRNYTTFEALCRQQPMESGKRTGDWEIQHNGLTINFLDLQQCLKNLSPRKKEAVFYNVIMDEIQRVVAERMGISTVTVGQYVGQGMRQVAKELWPEDYVTKSKPQKRKEKVMA